METGERVTGWEKRAVGTFLVFEALVLSDSPHALVQLLHSTSLTVPLTIVSGGTVTRPRHRAADRAARGPSCSYSCCPTASPGAAASPCRSHADKASLSWRWPRPRHTRAPLSLSLLQVHFVIIVLLFVIALVASLVIVIVVSLIGFVTLG